MGFFGPMLILESKILDQIYQPMLERKKISISDISAEIIYMYIYM